MHYFLISCLTFLLSLGSFLKSEDVKVTNSSFSNNRGEITLTFELGDKEKIYKDSLSLNIDDPSITLLNWSVTQQPTNAFDPIFNENKASFDQSFQVIVKLEKKDAKNPVASGGLHISYLLNTHNSPQEKVFPVNFDTPDHAKTTHSSPSQTSTSTGEQLPDPALKTNSPAANATSSLVSSSQNNTGKSLGQFLSTSAKKTQSFISGLLEHNSSFALRILLSFLLGLLMSLTPCIFPMIPVTMGILQATESGSNTKNFLLALCYTLGVSLTFALLGLAVSSGGLAFGQLMSNPFFVLSLVTFLIYLALSMFGVYEMYIPRFLQGRNAKVKQGSFLSAFAFGALSGTMASPCLSPGLALILTIVASLGNTFLGFILLFAFGVGSALPLLIIGTFSTSLNILPKAGLWMVEVKKLFGFMIFALCFYYLSTLVSTSILMWLIGEFLLIMGIWYFSTVQSYDSLNIKRYKNIVGTILVASSVFVFMKAYKAYSQVDTNAQEQTVTAQEKESYFWNSNYQEAAQKAIAENKKIFVVYTTDFCPNCIILENKVLKQQVIRDELNRFIPVKIDELDAIKAIIGKNRFLSTPSMLIIDPKEQKVVKEWQNGIPKEQTAEQFRDELKSY